MTYQRITQLIKEWVTFFWVHGVWIVARYKQIAWTAKRFSGDLFVPRYDSFPMNPEKKTLIPYIYNVFIYNFQHRHFLKFSEKSYKFKIPYSNGHLTSFDVLIIMPVIRLNCRTFWWLCSSGNELKIFSRV